jgi:hypothetical protein
VYRKGIIDFGSRAAIGFESDFIWSLYKVSKEAFLMGM